MSDRYYAYGHNGRPLSYNPATSSVPSGIGYTGSGSMYSGDTHIMPSASSSSRHHVTPRGYYTSNPTGGVPTTTRTFAVNHDPRSRPSRETSRTRRSTLDSTSRPPVIVTTSSHKDRANAASSHSSGTRSGHSPTRDDLYYGQNSPNSRPSRHHRTYSANYDDDYSRHRDTSLSRRDAEAYRNSRPSVVYPSDPRHSTAAVDFGSGDYGTDGYQYTNAGELARYDLDNPRASRRRRDSVDRGYYRPSLSYNTDQRSLNVNTSPDLSRNYTSNTSRLYDGRGGPPPSTRGFDRINSRWDDPEPRSASGAVPSSSTPGSTFEVAGGSGRRSRPTSMYADGAPRSGLPDDYYRRDDDRVMRDPRDREPDRPASSAGYHDSGVSSRGFGLRTGPPPGVDPQDRRRESRQEQPAKRSDESLKRDSDNERRERHNDRPEGDDPRRERREARRPSDEEEKERTRLRDKVTGGLGIAAAAVGLAPSVFKDDDKEKEKGREPRRRPSPDEDHSTRKEMPPIEPKAPLPEPSERERKPSDEDLTRQPPPVDHSAKDRMRRDAEARLNGEAVAPASGSDSDEGRRARRRHRPSHSFNPNDATDLTKLKEQLAAMKVSEKGREREDPTTARDETPRPPSPRNEIAVVEPSHDDSRGRELSVSSESKQVRLVSPPRDKKGDKPVRGILKAPSAAFPEEANPIREGVAPHKEDKKLKEVPAGARWTKISRRKVNPEALEVGKERFEVRDDFVIVLRVLSAEEIQAYATATQILRDRRRKERDGRDPDKAREEGEEDEPKRRHHRHHDADDDADRERERERDSERRSRRHKRSGEDDEYDTSDQPHHHHHHSHHQRSFRERERERGRDREWVVES